MRKLDAVLAGVSAGATVVLLLSIPWGGAARIAVEYGPAAARWLTMVAFLYCVYGIVWNLWLWIAFRIGGHYAFDGIPIPGRVAAARIAGLAAWGVLLSFSI